jgi:glycosyltransferase involved in cell wall biosynthesis
MNIEDVLRQEEDISASVIPVRPVAPTTLPLFGNWSLQTSLTTRKLFAEEARRVPLDAAFIHTQVAALLSVRLMRTIPTVVSLDATPVNLDSMAVAYRHPVHPHVIELAKRHVCRRALLGASAVVTWSKWAGDSVVSDYGVPAGQVHVIPPGVDLRRFRPRDAQRAPGPARLLFVGGDFERKGGNDLFEALKPLGDSVELDVVSASAHVPPGLPVRVHRDIQGNSDAVVDLYRRADIFVLPSRGDCLSLAVAEAMACGLPIVATPIGGLTELVSDGDNGYLVPPSSPDQLSRAVSTLVNDASLRQRMGARSRAIAVADHDAHRNTTRIVELMRTISAQASGRRG